MPQSGKAKLSFHGRDLRKSHVPFFVTAGATLAVACFVHISYVFICGNLTARSVAPVLAKDERLKKLIRTVLMYHTA